VLAEESLREAVRGAGIEAEPRFDEVTESTNRTALVMAEDGAPEWTVVAAGHQTAGRGRLGRTWVSRPGAAVQFSVVLRPTALEPERIGLLSLAAGVAGATACRKVAGAGVACKWPNDLLLGNAKVGGILAEVAVSGMATKHLVIGVGINLEAPEGVEGAGGIGDADPAGVVGAFLRAFRPLCSGDAMAERILEVYRPLCATLGRPVRAFTVDGRTVEGMAESIDARGNLVVAEYLRRSTVGFGEVEHIR
jgi:BirA family biotin operon repressor/biotin-[acetyl-CoA-carboxylase] ligase